MMTDELKLTLLSCPFCGSGILTIECDGHAYFVRCHGCGMCGVRKQLHGDTIAAWNTRVPDPAAARGWAAEMCRECHWRDERGCYEYYLKYKVWRQCGCPWFEPQDREDVATLAEGGEND